MKRSGLRIRISLNEDLDKGFHHMFLFLIKKLIYGDEKLEKSPKDWINS